MEKNGFTHKQWVLVRATKYGLWALAQFSNMDNGLFIVVGGNVWNYCIPFEGNEHLLGTNKDYVEQWQPKDGDFVYVQCKGGNEYIYIQKGGTVTGCYTNIWVGDNIIGSAKNICNVSEIIQIRAATTKEKKQLLDALHEEGKDWNEVKKEIVEYRWNPKGDEQYWYISDILIIDDAYWDDDEYDYCRMDAGNCFRTREEAQAMADKFKKLLKGGKE